VNTLQIVGAAMLIGCLLFVYFGLWFLAIRDVRRGYASGLEGITMMLVITMVVGGIFFLVGSVQ
jgi:hypothetical protein